MSDEGPPLLRPVPRRPFDIGLMMPTPPEEDSQPPSPHPEDVLDPGFLDPRGFGPGVSDEGDLSRAASLMNLTQSTLFGIYSPTTSPTSDRWDTYNDGQEPGTPWGTGAETPARRETMDDATYELVKERSNVRRRRSSARSGQLPVLSQKSTKSVLSSLGLRGSILFVLGMGYGALLSKLHVEKDWTSFPVEGIMNPGYDWRYLAFWGSCGVAMGSLLPWFDGMWEQTIDYDDFEDVQEASADTDWALVVRGIGAFAGIVFAIRKLPWASTMQVSMTLALVNPFLWYLIDRSKSGFLLSTGVCIAGSAVLMGLNPEIMPTPSGFVSDHFHRNGTMRPHSEPMVLGGLASQDTVETGVWMLSVLFCSCVCFGNIGRRLALNRSAVGRGRWGGVR